MTKVAVRPNVSPQYIKKGILTVHPVHLRKYPKQGDFPYVIDWSPVIRHSEPHEIIVLTECFMYVNKTISRRIFNGASKQRCAAIIGTIANVGTTAAAMTEIYFNPKYGDEFFHDDRGRKVERSNIAVLSGRKAWIS